MKTAFIGGGNMATALIGGILQQTSAPEELSVADPSQAARERLAGELGIPTHEHAADAVRGAEVIVLAVKPQVMPAVLADLARVFEPRQLVLSVAAGITVELIRGRLGADAAVVRSMPNTPALLGCGVTGLFSGPGCSQVQERTAEDIMSAVGATVWVDREDLMDVVTAVSGSGPAYFYLLAEALQAAGEGLGLPAGVAGRLARHTLHGAGMMAAHGGAEVAELRRRVTSPGGTTQAALHSLQADGFIDTVERAVGAASRRGRELAAQAGEA